MNIKEYQEKTKATAIYPPEHALAYLGLGIASEAGEVAGKLKKIIRDNGMTITDDKRLEIADEIGDCMWYISQICNELGISLQTVMEMNVTKLQDRQRRNVLKGSGDKR